MDIDRSQTPQLEGLPHFRQRPGDPVLPYGQAGIRIAAAGFDGPPGQRRWPLHGCFRVPRALAEAEPESILQRIVLTLRYASTHDIQARRAFPEELVFPEDVYPHGEMVGGSFHLDLLRTFEFIAPEDSYFIAASIAEYVSDVIVCPAKMPWLAAAPSEPAPEDTDTHGDEAGADEDREEDNDTSWMIDDPA
jgi:hypothetical protein